MERMKNDPAFAEQIKSARGLVRKAVVDRILEQHYSCAFADVYVTRQEHILTVEWQLSSSIKGSGIFEVVGSIEDVALIPDLDGGSDQLFVFSKGNGSKRLELDFGHAYFLSFQFINPEVAGFGPDAVQHLSFFASIPVPDEKRTILKALLAISPEERLRSKMEKNLDMQDEFDEMCRKAAERIKAKNLPPDEEADRINRFIAEAGMLKDTLEM